MRRHAFLKKRKAGRRSRGSGQRCVTAAASQRTDGRAAGGKSRPGRRHHTLLTRPLPHPPELLPPRRLHTQRPLRPLRPLQPPHGSARAGTTHVTATRRGRRAMRHVTRPLIPPHPPSRLTVRACRHVTVFLVAYWCFASKGWNTSPPSVFPSRRCEGQRAGGAELGVLEAFSSAFALRFYSVLTFSVFTAACL